MIIFVEPLAATNSGSIIFYREFLLECARKVGVEGAAEFLEDPTNGLKEVWFSSWTFSTFHLISQKIPVAELAFLVSEGKILSQVVH